MNNQGLMIIQFLFALFFIWWLLSKRGRIPPPTTLNMRLGNNPDSEDHKIVTIEKTQVFSKYSNYKFAADSSVAHAKSLNVIFMWNGHSWDAYEVFGLVAGSAFEQVEYKYHEMMSSADEGQQQFLRTAFEAIRMRS